MDNIVHVIFENIKADVPNNNSRVYSFKCLEIIRDSINSDKRFFLFTDSRAAEKKLLNNVVGIVVSNSAKIVDKMLECDIEFFDNENNRPFRTLVDMNAVRFIPLSHGSLSAPDDTVVQNGELMKSPGKVYKVLEEGFSFQGVYLEAT